MAQKMSLSAPVAAGKFTGVRKTRQSMDIGIIAAIAMLVVWAIGTFGYEPAGWFHLLLTAGTFLLIWRIVARDTRRMPGKDAPPGKK